MESFISFLNSNLFANILALLGLVIAIIPQKDTVFIDNSTTYYFKSETTDRSNDQIAILLSSFSILFTYITYTFFQSYYSIILLSLTFLVMIKYKILRIAYRKQMIIPAILIILSITLNHFLPSEVINYWHNTSKIDIQQSDTLSKLFDQLINPINEIINLIKTAKTTPLSIAILANITFITMATNSMLNELFRPKQKIKVTKNSDIITTILFLVIIVSFIFYTEKNSPARIITEHVIYFLTN